MIYSESDWLQRDLLSKLIKVDPSTAAPCFLFPTVPAKQRLPSFANKYNRKAMTLFLWMFCTQKEGLGHLGLFLVQLSER